MICIKRATIHKVELYIARYMYKHAYRTNKNFEYHDMYKHIYTLCLLYRLGLRCVKDLKLSLLGEALFIK